MLPNINNPTTPITTQPKTTAVQQASSNPDEDELRSLLKNTSPKNTNEKPQTSGACCFFLVAKQDQKERFIYHLLQK